MLREEGKHGLVAKHIKKKHTKTVTHVCYTKTVTQVRYTKTVRKILYSQHMAAKRQRKKHMQAKATSYIP